MSSAPLSPEGVALLQARQKVLIIEENIRKLQQLKIPVEHLHWGGIYARKIVIPKGALVTGEIHKYANLNFMYGDLTVLVDDHIERLIGFAVVLSPPGTKRIAFANEDTVWITTLPTNEQDPEVIRKLFTASTEEEYQQFLALASMEMPKCLS
jgi:hypothetical protein